MERKAPRSGTGKKRPSFPAYSSGLRTDNLVFLTSKDIKTLPLLRVLKGSKPRKYIVTCSERQGPLNHCKENSGKHIPSSKSYTALVSAEPFRSKFPLQEKLPDVIEWCSSSGGGGGVKSCLHIEDQTQDLYPIPAASAAQSTLPSLSSILCSDSRPAAAPSFTCLQLHSRTALALRVPHALYGYLSPSCSHKHPQLFLLLFPSPKLISHNLIIHNRYFPPLLLLAPAQAIPPQITSPYGPCFSSSSLPLVPRLELEFSELLPP
ncbi:hypothetical protein M0R45_001806 [Rubus argutus]|uniref:Uncharacterized protein n=1 Tax=Rubus argutus TaxID=59490 RepID=A0AAW1VJY7_RUBAR